MLLKKNEAAFFIVIIFFALAISIVAYTVNYTNPWNLAVRLFALNGFIALCIAAIMTAFLKELTLFLKKPFTKVHHYFAAAGLVLITLHPITLAIQFSNPAVFVPNVESPYSFLFFGGRQALIIIYIAFAVVLLRRKITAYWRPFHALMYVALFFGIIHADLSGRDFINSPLIFVVFNGLFAATIVAFVLKRLQFYNMKNKRKQLSAQAKPAIP
jgi:methionine sulfoxide reductase heme-binding subunit